MMGGIMPGARKRAVSPAKRGASPAGLCQSEEVQHVLRQLEGAECRSKFNGVSFLTEAKVFAFQAQDGLVLKLPVARVQELVREREARALVMGKRVMKEWVVVGLPQGLRGEMELLREAKAFVVRAAAG
jgi:hypothetical protein